MVLLLLSRCLENWDYDASKIGSGPRPFCENSLVCREQRSRYETEKRVTPFERPVSRKSRLLFGSGKLFYV